MPSKIYHVAFTDSEQEALSLIIPQPNPTRKIVTRSKILLATDHQGSKHWKDSQIVTQYEVSTPTINRLRKRIIADGFSVALKGKPRKHLPPKKFDGQVASLSLSDATL